MADEESTDYTYRPDQKDDPGKYGSHPGDDLPKKGDGASLETLADYLHHLTARNAYPIDKGLNVTAPPELGKTQPLTSPPSRDSSLSTAHGNYWFTNTPGIPTELNSLSDSGKFEPLSDFLDKEGVGISRGSGSPLIYSDKSGNRLLVDVVAFDPPLDSTEQVPEHAPEVQKRISAVLKTNRFSPGPESPYMDSGNADDPHGAGGDVEDYTSGYYVPQNELGKFQPNPESSSQYEALFADLKKIGHELTIAATGHPADWHDGMSLDLGFLGTVSLPPEDMLMLPSFNQLAPYPAKIGAGDLRAKNMPSSPYKIAGKELNPLEKSFDLNPGDRESYGQLNSPHEVFDGAAPLGMMVLSLALMIGVLVVGKAALLLLPDNEFGVDGDPRTKKNPQIDLEPGNWRKGSGEGFAQYMRRYLGIPLTENEFDTCIDVGISTFLGMPEGKEMDFTSTDSFSGLGSAALNLIQSPGFYVGIFRNAVRDTEQITKSLENFGVSISGTVGAALILVDAIATSATWRFLMVMAALGEIRQISKAGLVPRLYGGELDTLPNQPRTRAGKNRISGEVSTLAWGHMAVPSLYLLPPGMTTLETNLEGIGGSKPFSLSEWKSRLAASKTMDAAADYPDDDGWYGMEIENDVIPSLHSRHRLTPEQVQKFENHLEMEYVPFYFHDLRTNEFIAFHAFIDSITDSWSPEYSSTSGMGRMDPVQMHSKTTRTIALTFNLVATNEGDFDRMWWDVNKLVSMLYPQWSQGTTVAGGKEKFIMPFSQVPTASPMIRLRVGDLIKSNYSNPSMARLFGANAQNSKDSETFVIGKAAADAAAAVAANKRKEAIIKYTTQITERIKKGQRRAGGDNGAAVGEFITVPESAYEGKKKIIDIDGKKEGIWWDAVKTGGIGPYGTVYRAELKEIRKKTHSVQKRTGWWVAPAEVFGEGPQTQSQADTLSETGAGETGDSIPVASVYKTIRWSTLEYRVELKLPAKTPLTPKIYNMWIPASKTEVCESWVKATAELQAASDHPDTPATIPDVDTFFNFTGNPSQNPVVRAFKSSGGRGLAGFITSMNMDYASATWETQKLGKRAPKFMKISMNFAPTHDIPLGLDHEGFMRAPAYPVGGVNNAVFGDPWGDNLEDGEVEPLARFNKLATNGPFKGFDASADE
jgi:hypothetical protein